MEGWIKLHRKIQDNPLWLSESFTDGQAWVDMIMLANHKTNTIKKRGIRIDVQRGYIGWSEAELSKRWKWSRGKLRRFFKFMVQQNMIEIEQQKLKLTTLIKIVNYSDYQGDDTTKGIKVEHETVQQTDMKRYTNNNDKKENNEKKDIIKKDLFLDSVYLTAEETTKLKEKFNSNFDKAIEILNNYKMQSGKKYKSDYHTLLGWVAKEIDKINISGGLVL